MELENGKVYVVSVHSNKGLLGEIIRFFERLRYGMYSWSNHTCIAVQDKGIFYVYEAEAQGVIKTGLKRWLALAEGVKDCRFIAVPDKYFKLEITDYTLQHIADNLNKRVGDRYDIDDLLLVEPFNMITGAHLADNDKNSFICSRLVTVTLNEFTNNLFPETDISPAQVFKIMSELK